MRVRALFASPLLLLCSFFGYPPTNIYLRPCYSTQTPHNTTTTKKTKKQILLKQPEGKTIGRGDRFAPNPRFTDRLKRIRVPLPPVDERKRVVEDVDKDRRHAVDAAVVRVMKSRRQLQHQQLVLEVVQQLQRMFRPDLKLVKRRIEDLIQREYIERDRDNPQLFRYLA